jgi:hypothetical protein
MPHLYSLTPHARRAGKSTLSRRRFLLSAMVLGGWAAGCATTSVSRAHGGSRTRGVVLVPEDLSLGDWPERAHGAGLTTIALHHGSSPREVARMVQSAAGARFLARCRELGLDVEYELHAMKELLPRDLFARNPALFRMNDRGERTPDANCCAHSREGIEIICENAVQLSALLRPTTHRYFLWGDDGQPGCRCPQCAPYSDSDQAVLLENELIRALRRHDPKAMLAHLAYARTLEPPTRVKPNAHLFLEFAPINRRYDIPYRFQSSPTNKDRLSALEANLRIFPAASAQVLEYWLDVSRASGWRRPAKRLPWRRDVLVDDLHTYTQLGIRHITSFGAWIDAEYVKLHGQPDFITEYGQSFSQ